MTKLEKAVKFYDKINQDFFRDVSIYLEHGFVYSDPNSILLAKPVKKNDGCPINKWIEHDDADAWYVHFAIGENCFKQWWSKIPFKLSYIGFGRALKNKKINYYKSENFFRRINNV
jgi:hypothetical protein